MTAIVADSRKTRSCMKIVSIRDTDIIWDFICGFYVLYTKGRDFRSNKNNCIKNFKEIVFLHVVLIVGGNLIYR